MKKSLTTLLFLVLSVVAFAQLQTAPQWNRVLSDQPETFRTQLISSSENSIQVNVQVPGFYTTNVATPRGEAKIVTMPKAVSTAQAGEPDVPMTGIPAIIGDQARMNIRVVASQYMDFEGIEVAPSKGDFPRTIDPADVPYTYGECYSQDAFFPASNVGLYEPYIVRDFRGQNMVIYPFAYNPVSKTLRVYYNMTVEMYKVDNNGVNTMQTNRSNVIKLDPDFKSVYQRHFINYEAGMRSYTPLDEEGDLLIICYDNFYNSMSDFVNWKKTRGVNTTIVKTSTISSNLTYSNLKTYIQSQYNANNNLTHVLLVGDVAQIPGYSYSGGGSDYSGLGDNAYGQIVGNDIYNDVFIGRFSASSTTHVATQVQKVITYERDLTTSATWCQNGMGVSTSSQSGHNNEQDYQHIENIRTDLSNFGYSTVYQEYYGVSGYSSTTTTISNHINSGVGIINYCNHGSETSWGSHSYSNTHVNNLTNSNKLPFIFSVACLNGKYDHSSDCFAEAWMRATKNNSLTGAVGTMMSYISQPWLPPMWAQDEFVDILTEHYNSNIKHTWGGTAINGIFGIFDNYSTSNQSAVGTYQAWILYGDPSLMLRTKTPQAMTVNHDGSIPFGSTSYTVNVSNGNGALATITDASHNILGRATVSNGVANITISGTTAPGTELTLCVFGYNKVTYLGTINVVGGTQYTITATANPVEGGVVTGAGEHYENNTCTLTATANEGYTFVNWTKNGTQVSTETTYSFTVTENAAYVANFQINSYSVTATVNLTAGGTISGMGSYNHFETCTLTATPNETYSFINWTKNGIEVSTNAIYSFTVTEDAAFVANFALNSYTVTATPSSVEGGSVTVSSNRNRDELFYDFEDGTAQGWTTLQGPNSDSPNNWMHCASYLDDYSTSHGHNASNGFMLSESYVIDDETGSVHPDNYLVSPRILLGGSITFWVTNVESGYAEHFAVAVSTNGNTDANDFTNIQEWTLAAKAQRTGNTRSLENGTWYEYTVDLSEYVGWGYVAIRHFDCYDQWLLCVDDITIVEGEPYTGAVSGIFNHGESCTVTATANEGYAFVNWTENEEIVSTNASYTFTVTGERNLVANFTTSTPTVQQPITLIEGWNWWAPNVAITLEDFEAALGSYGVSIISQEGYTNIYSSFGWGGNLDAIEVGKMYMVQVNAACTITVSGIVVDPSEYPVTINPDANWIGFIGTEEMSLDEAFAGFTPTNMDNIKTQNGGIAIYYQGRGWRGRVTTLKPGEGFIYTSKASTSQTFTFPAE